MTTRPSPRNSVPAAYKNTEKEKARQGCQTQKHDRQQRRKEKLGEI